MGWWRVGRRRTHLLVQRMQKHAVRIAKVGQRWALDGILGGQVELLRVRDAGGDGHRRCHFDLHRTVRHCQGRLCK